MKRTNVELMWLKEMEELVHPFMNVLNEDGSTNDEENLWKEFFNEFGIGQNIDETICYINKVKPPFQCRFLFLKLFCGGVVPFYVNTEIYDIHTHAYYNDFKKILTDTKLDHNVYRFCFNVVRYCLYIMAMWPKHISREALKYVYDYKCIFIDIACHMKLNKKEKEQLLTGIDIFGSLQSDYSATALRYLFESNIDIDLKKLALCKIMEHFNYYFTSLREKENLVNRFRSFVCFCDNKEKYMQEFLETMESAVEIKKVILCKNSNVVSDILFNSINDLQTIRDKAFSTKREFEVYLIRNLKIILGLDNHELYNEKPRINSNLLRGVKKRFMENITSSNDEVSNLLKVLDERIEKELSKEKNKALKHEKSKRKVNERREQLLESMK